MRARYCISRGRRLRRASGRAPARSRRGRRRADCAYRARNGGGMNSIESMSVIVVASKRIGGMSIIIVE